MQNINIKEKLTIKNITIIAMLISISVATHFVTITISNFIQISFGFLAIALISSMYGITVGAIAAGISDIVGSILMPTGPFFPGFTLSAVLGGIIYGIFLYKNKTSLIRVFLSMLSVGIIVNVLVNSLWLKIMYGYGFLGLLPMRIAKNAITIPLNTILAYLLFKALNKTNIFKIIDKK